MTMVARDVMINLDEYSSDEPIDEETLEVYHRVTERIKHVLNLVESKPYRNQNYGRDSIRIGCDNIFVEYSYSWRNCDREYAEDQIPTKYLFMADVEIKNLEQQIRKVKDDELLTIAKNKKDQELQIKRNQLNRLKKELGEE